MGYSKEEGEAIEAAVRGVVESAIANLQALGLTHDSALQLLVIQAAVRMNDADPLKRSVEDYMDTLR